MQKVYLLMAVILCLFLGIGKTIAQPQVAGYSDLNDVYSLYFDDNGGTNDTMWIGTSGGVVYRVSTDFSVAHTITRQDDGIGSNFVTAIVTDDNGNKFFGTFEDGITVYNNGIVTTYNSTNSVINNKINCMALDVNGFVWAGTPTGAYRYNGTSWDAYNSASQVSTEVKSMAVDGDTIWFGTSNQGLYLYDINSNIWAQETSTNSVISSGNITHIASNNITALAVRNDSLLIGTPGGISFFNPAGSTWVTEIVGAAGNEIYDIVMWDFGTFYASTTNGLFSSGGSIWTLDGMLPYNPTGVLERVNYELWIGFNENMKGVLPYMFSTPPPAYTVNGTQYPNSNSISGVISRNNETYFSTSGSGLLVFDGTQWRIEEISDFPNLTLSDMDIQMDTIWLAAGYDGVATYDPTFGLNVYGLSDNTANVLSVGVDKRDNKRIWCGTEKGVFSFYGYTEEATHFTQGNGQLLNDIVKKIAVDINGVVWFMHVNGITRYDETNTGNEFSYLSTSNLGLTASAELSDIAADSNGEIWITSNQGVVEFNSAGSATVYTTVDGLTDNIVTSVYIDSRNIKYLGTMSGGITTMSPYGFRKITKSEGLLTNHIKAVAYDETSGKIWSGGDWGGISATTITDVSYEGSTPPSPICYGENLTLSVTAFNGFGPGSYNYTWTDSEGTEVANTANITVTPRASITSYSVEINDGFTSITSSFPITVNSIDTSLISGPQNVCANNTTVNYSVPDNPNKTYNWTINGGDITNSQTLHSIDVTWRPDGSGNYLILTETGTTNNCSVTQQFDVSLLSISQSAITGPLELCPDGSLTTYSLSVDPNRSYEWSVTGGQIESGQNASQVNIQWDLDILSGNLSLKETDNTNNCSIDQYFDINFQVRDTVQILLKGESLLICTDSGRVDYQWFYNNEPVANANKQFHYVDLDQGAPTGNYHLEIGKNSVCRTTSTPIQIINPNLKVYPMPAKSTLNIDFVSNSKSEGKMIIRNSQGIFIREAPFYKEELFKQLEIDVSNYTPGTYFFTIMLEDRPYTSGKFIVN